MKLIEELEKLQNFAQKGADAAELCAGFVSRMEIELGQLVEMKVDKVTGGLPTITLTIPLNQPVLVPSIAGPEGEAAEGPACFPETCIPVAAALPDPETSPVPTPEPDAETPLTPARAPLQDSEVVTILNMLAKGKTSGEIAKALYRDPRGFYHQVNRVMKDAEADTDHAAQVALEPEPEAAPEEPAPTPKPVATDDATELAEQNLPAPTELPADIQALPTKVHPTARRLMRLRYDAPWTIGASLDLLEQLAKGKKLSAVADEFGVAPAAANSRFRQLLPTPTVEMQRYVAQVLRALLDAERTAA